jgi:hypothetical protein
VQGVKMGLPTIVPTIAVTLLAAALGACEARAEDQIKAGKWKFTVLVPGVTQPPPGMQPQPGVQVGPSGVTMESAECVSSENPLPPMARGPSAPIDANHPCEIDKTNVSGATVSWSWSCTTAEMTFHLEGIVHYHGETLDGEFTVRTSTPGHPPIEMSHSLTGRYLGPCDNK